MVTVKIKFIDKKTGKTVSTRIQKAINVGTLMGIESAAYADALKNNLNCTFEYIR